MNNLNKGTGKTPYELESLGWKINALKGSPFSKCDFNIFHAFYFPYGHEMNDTTIHIVLEFINNFITQEQHKEETERFNLDR